MPFPFNNLGEVLNTLTKGDVKQLIKDENAQNFTVKEVVLMKFNEMTNQVDGIMSNCKTCTNKFNTVLTKHEDAINHILAEMPNKGFCTKVEGALELDKPVTTRDKVETLFHDRRWIKGLTICTVSLLIMIVGDKLVAFLG